MWYTVPLKLFCQKNTRLLGLKQVTSFASDNITFYIRLQLPILLVRPSNIDWVHYTLKAFLSKITLSD